MTSKVTDQIRILCRLCSDQSTDVRTNTQQVLDFVDWFDNLSSPPTERHVPLDNHSWTPLQQWRKAIAELPFIKIYDGNPLGAVFSGYFPIEMLETLDNPEERSGFFAFYPNNQAELKYMLKPELYFKGGWNQVYSRLYTFLHQIMPPKLSLELSKN